MRRLGIVGAVAACIGSVLFGVGASAQEGDAQVRVAHLSPDTAGVDVYMDGQRALGNVGFDTVSEYLRVPAGDHALALRPHGAAADSKPVLSAEVTFEAGRAYTVAGVGLRDDLTGKVYEDDLSAPPPGKARLRLIHAAPEVDEVDIALEDGTTLFEGTGFPDSTTYAELTPGAYSFELRNAASSSDVLFTSPSVDVGAGIIYTVAAIGGAGKPVQLLVTVDARGLPADAPAGGVATGAGGTAGERGESGFAVWPVAVAVAAVAGLGVLGVRRRRAA